MHFISVLLLMVLVAAPRFAFAAPASCAGPGNTPRDNMCATVIDEETGRAAPNCVNTGTQSAPDWHCGVCAMNCDCAVGRYCVKSPGPTAGSCVAFAKTDKIGAVCTEFDVPDTPNAKLPTRGVDDAFLCGDATFADATSIFIGYDWMGACVKGVCAECGGDRFTSTIATAQQLVALRGNHAPNENNTAWRDGGCLLCNDRFCDHGAIRPQTTYFEEFYLTGAVSAILIFLVMLFILMLITSITECCARWRDTKMMKNITSALPLYFGGNMRTRRLREVMAMNMSKP